MESNVSIPSYDEIVSKVNNIISRRRLPTMALTAVILAFGVVGNLIVLCVYWRIAYRKKKYAAGRYLIRSLAVADFLACVFGGSFFLYFDRHRITFYSSFLCKFAIFSSFTTNHVSVLFLLIISLHRFLKICKPHGPQLTLHWRRVAIIAVIAFSTVAALPFFYFSDVVETTFQPTDFKKVLSVSSLPYATHNITAYTCWAAYPRTPAWRVYYNILFFVQVINICAMIGLYIPMGRVIYLKHKQHKKEKVTAKDSGIELKGVDKIEDLNSESATNQASVSYFDQYSNEQSDTMAARIHNKGRERRIRQRKDVKIKYEKTWTSAKNRFTKMFMVVVIIYAITNFPTFIFLYMIMESNAIDKHFVYASTYYEFNFILSLTRFHLINNVINPFIYGYFDIGFRGETKTMFVDILGFLRAKLTGE